MKVNLTHALAAAALLLIVVKVTRANALKRATTTAQGAPGSPINGPAEWWTYAGSWQ